MSVHHHHNQYILAAAGDHEILTQAVESFQKLFAADKLPNTPKELAALQHLLETKLPHHFAYEEAQVFPSLLADQPQLDKQIAELCREHATMLQEARHIQKLLAGQDLANLWSALLVLFAALHKHTGKEDELFRPYLPGKK